MEQKDGANPSCVRVVPSPTHRVERGEAKANTMASCTLSEYPFGSILEAASSSSQYKYHILLYLDPRNPMRWWR